MMPLDGERGTMVSWSELCEARILVVDDDRLTVQLFEDMLRRAGYQQVTTTTEPARGRELFRAVRPDLVLLDLHMGAYSGMELLHDIHEELDESEFLPVLVISGDASDEAKLNALNLGAKDFITKPFDMVETMLRIRIRLETRFRYRDMQRELHELRAKVRSLQGGGLREAR